MPASLKNIQKPYVRNRYLDGKLYIDPDYTQSHITFLPDNSGGFVCTCGNRIGNIKSLSVHKRTFNHLILTKQIKEYHPTLNCHQQRDILIASGIRIW